MAEPQNTELAAALDLLEPSADWAPTELGLAQLKNCAERIAKVAGWKLSFGRDIEILNITASHLDSIVLSPLPTGILLRYWRDHHESKPVVLTDLNTLYTKALDTIKTLKALRD